MFDDRIKNKKETLPNRINNFFSSVITEIVPWDLNENAGWFEAQVSKQVSEPISVLRRCLRKIGQNHEDTFVKLLSQELELSQQSGYYFDRDRISSIVKNNFNGTTAYIPISQFFDLLYYVSGSRVVNCENYVPQENLIYYNHATMNFGQRIISDKAVFHNIITNVILSNIYDNTFPIDIIKNISITDIIELRESNKNASQLFRRKYEQCLKVADNIQNIEDKDNLLLNLQELNTLSEGIRSQFNQTIVGELASFKSKLKISKSVDYVFEIVSQLIGLFSLPVSIISLIFNDTQLRQRGLLKKIRENNTIAKDKLIRMYLKKVYKNDTALISFFNDIIRKHKENYMKINF